MKSLAMLTCAAWACLAAGAAFGQTCSERLDELEARLDEMAEVSISASSGGQGVAGSREAQAMTGSGEPDEPVVPYQEEQEETEAVERAEDAGEGGDLVMRARATLEDARESSEGGDDAACEKALDEVARMIEEHEAATE